jgi:hypothetical protein
MAVAGYPVLGRTLGELVAATEEHLGKSRHQMNKLADPIPDGTAGTITVQHEIGGLRPGTYFEVDDEVMYVWAVTGQTVTVERGQLSTVPAVHADNSLVRVNPRFLRVSILRALREEIASWPLSVYAVMQGEFDLAVDTTSMDVTGIPPGTHGVRLLKVWRQQTGTVNRPDRWPHVSGVMLEPAANVDFYPSGYRLVWPKTYTASTYQVALGGPFRTAPFTTATDLGSIGLTASMVDIPPMGAAARLLLPREISRTDDAAIGRSRLAEEVPPGHTSRTAAELFTWRDNRIEDEARRLLNDYGWTE